MRSILLLFLFVSVLSHAQPIEFKDIDFRKADSIALAHKGQYLDNLPVLTQKLTADLSTDVEKFRAIYTWVSTTIENDYGSYLVTTKKRKKHAKDRAAYMAWNDRYTPKMFQKIIKEQKTACTGYAYLIRELAHMVDIDCKIINGYGRTPTLHLSRESLPNHSWNAVQLNNKWYLCDATWSAGTTIVDENGPTFKAAYFDGYFLADPALFIKNHYPLEAEWALLPEPPTFNAFIEGPIVYKESFIPHIIPLSPTVMRIETTKDTPVSFQLQTSKNFDGNRLGMALFNGIASQNVHPIILQDQTGFALKYVFERSGLFDVHILLDDAIVATYVVKVKRK